MSEVLTCDIKWHLFVTEDAYKHYLFLIGKEPHTLPVQYTFLGKEIALPVKCTFLSWDRGCIQTLCRMHASFGTEIESCTGS